VAEWNHTFGDNEGPARAGAVVDDRGVGVERARVGEARRARAGWDSLTGTERMVAELVAAGKGNAAIADELGISRRTVESHLYHAFAKLAVDNRTALAVVVLAQR